MYAHRSLRPLVAPLTAMALIAASAGYLVTRASADPHAGQVSAARFAPAAATLGAASGSSPARSAQKPPKASRLYRFLLMQPDHVTPIRWNPCRPIHYRIALNGYVPASEAIAVRAAFSAAAAALGGVQFVDDGSTTVTPNAVDDSSRAGADLVVAFALPGTGPGHSGLLTGWEAGRGGFAASGVAGSNGVVIEKPTHGSIVIDASIWQRMTRHDRTVLYLHEIGHAVGLDHPADGRQIMSPGAYDLPARYQKGDLEGLALLGRQAGCTG